MSNSWQNNFICNCGAPLTISIMKGIKDLVTVGFCPLGHRKKFILSMGNIDQWASILKTHFFKCHTCDKPIKSQPFFRGSYVRVQITCPVHGKNETRLLPVAVYNTIVGTDQKDSTIATSPQKPAKSTTIQQSTAASPPTCQHCGDLTIFVPQYSRYYCRKCQRYVVDQKIVEKVRHTLDFDDLKSKIKIFAEKANENIPYAICDLPSQLNVPNIDSFQIELLLQELINKGELAGQIDSAIGEVIFLPSKLVTPAQSFGAASSLTKQFCAKCGSETEFVKAHNAYFCRHCYDYVKTVPSSAAIPTPEERVEALRDFDYVGGQIRFKIVIANKTKFVITAIRVDLDIPKEFKLVRILPETSLEDLNRGLSKIDKLMPNASQGIDYYLEPMTCGNGVLVGFVKYQDAQGNFKSLDLKPREVAIKCPLVFKPEEANVAMIRNLMTTLTEDYRRWALPTTPHESFKLLHETVTQFEINHIQAYQLSEAPEELEMESWYYTRAKTTNHPLVIKITVSERQNTLDLMIACESMAELTGLLSKISEDFQTKVLTKLGTTLKPAYTPLKELLCECGNPLLKLPSRSQDVICNSCQKTYTYEMLG